MSIVRSWFDYRQYCKQNAKQKLEKSIREDQNDLANYSLDKLYRNRKADIFCMIVSVFLCLFLALVSCSIVSSIPGEAPWLQLIFLSCSVYLVYLLESLCGVNFVATNRSIAERTTNQKSKQVH